MEQQKRRPWRRWVVLALMITTIVLGGIYVPVQPEISVKAENLLGEGVPWFSAPVIGDFYLVNTLFTLAITIIIVLLLVYFTNRSLTKSAKTDLVPRGIGNAMEAILEMLYNLTEGSAGVKWAKAIFPWFATIMIYVLLANLLKIIPGFETIGVLHHVAEGHPVNGPILLPGEVENGYVLVPFFRGISVDLNFTVSLALIAVIAIQVIGFRAQGWGYLSKFLNTRRMFKVPFFGAMDFLVGLLELISELSKILSFAFRLFGNMFAGVVLVAVIPTMLGAVLGRWSGNILPSMLMLFELFVGVIQAFVFGMLTMVFMAQATQGHGDEHAENH